ncbi:MAG: hypothetical protein OXT67_09905 [Zetaproteobacteria bacterium]|nr:hypothetical protein [Zetaproteobacteria bacterium]
MNISFESFDESESLEGLDAIALDALRQRLQREIEQKKTFRRPDEELETTEMRQAAAELDKQIKAAEEQIECIKARLQYLASSTD